MWSKIVAPALMSACVAVSACTSLVPTTVLQLNRLDPLTADPANFAVMMEMPVGLSLEQGSVEFIVNAMHSPSGQTWAESYTLNEFRDDQGRVTYVLPPAGVAGLRALQDQIADMRDTSDGNGTGEFSVSADPCRDANAAMGDDPRVSIFVRFEQDGPFRPLARGVPVLDFFDMAELQDFDVCGSGPF